MAIALAHLGGLAVSLPMALGGEAEGASGTGWGVISLISIVLGYLLLAALWYFVFRDKARSKRKRRSSD